jgi:hypothetical protein
MAAVYSTTKAMLPFRATEGSGAVEVLLAGANATKYGTGVAGRVGFRGWGAVGNILTVDDLTYDKNPW